MPESFATEAMGTRFELVLDGGDPVRLRSIAEEAIEEIRDAEQQLSRFRRDSLLAHIERRAPDWVELDQDLSQLYQLCADVHSQSQGAFDITVGGWMDRTGFHREGQTANVHEQGSHTASPSTFPMNPVELDLEGHRVRLTRTDVRLDFGGVGKGFALDRAGEVLDDHGVERFLLHGGTSTVVARGTPLDQDAWRVAVRHPMGTPAGDGSHWAQVHLRDRSLSVSANLSQTRHTDEGKVGHVVDPVTFVSDDTCRMAASVASSAARADAWSTAWLVLAARGKSLFLPEGVDHLLLCRDGELSEVETRERDPSNVFVFGSRHQKLSTKVPS